MDPLTVLNAIKIRILLLPAGDISREKYEIYSKLIRRCQKIELSELSPLLSSSGTLNSVFLRQIGSSGTIYFSFVEEDRAEELADFQDFQLYRRIFGAIGISQCGANDANYAEFSERISKFKHCEVNRFFAFEPSETVIDNDKDVIVIPNHGIEQVMFYMQTMMNDLAVSILRRFDSIAEEIGSMPRIESPRKYDESLPKDLQARLHLRYAGRKLKLLGDLYLLAGTYSEAVSNFVAASEETKAINDHFWNAGAQEGLQVALCLQNNKMLNEATTAEAFKDIWNSLPNKLKEIAVLYEKTVMSRLSFELLIQVADIYMKHGDRGEACQALTQAWNSCRPLVVTEKLVVLGTLVVKCDRMGLIRKSAFYRNRIAYHLLNLQMHSVALLFITQSMESFKIEEQHGWVVLKRRMLEKGIELAQECHEHSLALSLAFKCLSNTLNTLSMGEQGALAELLRIGSAKLHHRKLPPILVNASTLKVSAQVIKYENIKLIEPMMSPQGNGVTKPVLIFNPFSKKHSAKATLQKNIGFVGKSIRWLASITNPFAFQLDLTNIKLIVDDPLAVISEEVNISIEPNDIFEFYLNIYPKVAGEFKIEKIAFNIFDGLFTELAIKCQHFEIFPKQPSLSLSLLDLISIGPSKLELYDGEVKEIRLLIKNESNCMAKGLNLRSEASWELLPSSPTLSLAESFLPSNRKPIKLPPIADQLLPNESLIVTLILTGIRGNTENKIILEYAGDDDASSRSILQVSMAQLFTSVNQVLSIDSIAFFPHTSTRLDRSMEDCIAEEELQKMSLSRAPSGIASPKKVHTLIYGGQSTANLADDQDGLLELDPSEWCYASIDLTSHSSLPLFISFQADAHPDQSIRIPSMSSRRIVLPVRKIMSIDDDIDATELTDDQRIILRNIQDSPELLRECKELMIKKRLFNNLQLFWSCAAKKSGQLDLRHFQLDSSGISSLTLARHRLKIKLNEETAREGTISSLPTSKDIPLSLFFNTRASHHKFLAVQVSAFVNGKPAELQEVIIEGSLEMNGMAEESIQLDLNIFPISWANLSLSYSLTYEDGKIETAQHPISFVFY